MWMPRNRKVGADRPAPHSRRPLALPIGVRRAKGRRSGRPPMHLGLQSEACGERSLGCGAAQQRFKMRRLPPRARPPAPRCQRALPKQRGRAWFPGAASLLDPDAPPRRLPKRALPKGTPPGEVMETVEAVPLRGPPAPHPVWALPEGEALACHLEGEPGLSRVPHSEQVRLPARRELDRSQPLFRTMCWLGPGNCLPGPATSTLPLLGSSHPIRMVLCSFLRG